MRTTTIKITLKTRERLVKLMKYGQSYDKLINCLLDISEMETALQLPEEAPVQ